RHGWPLPARLVASAEMSRGAPSPRRWGQSARARSAPQWALPPQPPWAPPALQCAAAPCARAEVAWAEGRAGAVGAVSAAPAQAPPPDAGVPPVRARLGTPAGPAVRRARECRGGQEEACLRSASYASTAAPQCFRLGTHRL